MIRNNISFDVSSEVLALGIRCACFVVSGLHNKEYDSVFETEKNESIEHILDGFLPEHLQQDPVLAGFRELHTAIGTSNRKCISASETLLKGLLRTGTLPRVNLLVDIYNLISAKTRLSLGAHDTTGITGGVHLRITNGTESFHPLGDIQAKQAKPGEYAYIDDNNDVLCRLEVRQVEKTRITTDTTQAFFIIQGNSATSPEYITSTVQQLIDSIKWYCGGRESMLYLPG